MKNIILVFLLVTPLITTAHASGGKEIRICVHNPDDQINAWSVREAGEQKEFSYYPNPPVGYSCVLVVPSEITLDIILDTDKNSCTFPVMANKDLYLNLAQCQHRKNVMAIPKSYVAASLAKEVPETAPQVKAVKGPCDDNPAVATSRQQTSCLNQNNFNSLDKNKDGFLKKKEISQNQKGISKLDKNKDEQIDILEFMAAEESKASH